MVDSIIKSISRTLSEVLSLVGRIVRNIQVLERLLEHGRHIYF